MNTKMLSILRLALHAETTENEWHAAAIMFVRLLRKDKTEPEHLKLTNNGKSTSNDTRSTANDNRQGWTPHPSAQARGQTRSEWEDAFKDIAKKQREAREAQQRAR